MVDTAAAGSGGDHIIGVAAGLILSLLVMVKLELTTLVEMQVVDLLLLDQDLVFHLPPMVEVLEK